MGLNTVTDTIGGLFGGGGGNDSGAYNNANGALDAQIAMSKAELENKRQKLYQSRLDIIKSQGGENWTGARPTPTPAAPAKPSIPPWFPGGGMGMGL